MQDEIIKFLRLQLCVHHPGGVHTEDQGAFAVDWELWKVC